MTNISTLKTAAAVAAMIGASIAGISAASANGNDSQAKPGTTTVCTASGECYTSIVLGFAQLPNQGDFQQLIPGDDGLYTDAGPGDDGYRGGRWWVDVNGDGIQNEGDAFFMCPLLGGGPKG